MAENAEKKGEVVYYEGMPMSIHCNMQSGTFTEYGDDNTAKKSLSINIVGWRHFDGKMYQKISDEKKEIEKLIKELGCDEETAKAKEIEKNTKSWAEIFFINNKFDEKSGKKNPLCVMLLKTYSLANLNKEIRKWSYKFKEDGSPVQLHEILVEVTTKQDAKDGQKFYLCEFKFSEDKNSEASEAIENFLATKPFIYAQDNLEEILRNPHTYKLKKAKNWNLPPEFPNREFLSTIPVIRLINTTNETSEQPETAPQPQEQG